MKAILISIQPQHVANILNGNKTLEIRKTMPKCDLPIDVFIYCTKQKPFARRYVHNDKWGTLEYIRCDGKVVAKFTLNKVETIKLPYTYFGTNKWVSREHERTLQTETMDEKDILKLSCLTEEEIYKYLNFKHSPTNVGYAWHIDNLVPFDEPMELSDFRNCELLWNCKPRDCKGCRHSKPLTRAPQNWQFIEV